MEREALKLALDALEKIAYVTAMDYEYQRWAREAITAIKEVLAQPAHSEWNAALDEAAACIGEMKGFGKATQDSFAVFIQGLKK